MDTTLGLDESVSHFVHIIFKTINGCVYAWTCVCVCVCAKIVFEWEGVWILMVKFTIWD
jgi:hypothetical protein